MKKKIILIFFLILSYNLLFAQYQHFIIYGQSLSNGTQSYPVISTGFINGNFVIGDQIWIANGNSGSEVLNPMNGVVAKENIDITTGKVKSGWMNRSKNVLAECPLYGATNHIQLKTGGLNKYVATSCGVGGKTIEQLSKGTDLYQYFTQCLEEASNIVKDEGTSISCPALFWMQGEYNYVSTYGGTTDKLVYKNLLLTLKNNMQQDVMIAYGQTQKPIFITYQSGAQYVKNKEISVGMAQLETSNENTDIICAGPVYPMTDRGGHLDPNGYRWFGEMLGKVYYKTKVLGENFKPLQPLSISRTDDPKKIKVQFLVPHLPLILDDKLVSKQTYFGFDVYNGSQKDVIEDVSINGDCVYLTCAHNTTGRSVEVIYAGMSTLGHGNLRDSDPYSAFYNYTDLDKKNSDGTFFYPRDVTETTLRPDYEPVDQDGIIYNKPYPLYNFCVSFYYKLDASQQAFTIPNLVSETTTLTIKNDNPICFVKDNRLVMRGLKDSDLGSKVEVIDMKGLLISQFEIDVFPEKQIELNVDRGMYLFKLEGTRNLIVKFIK